MGKYFLPFVCFFLPISIFAQDAENWFQKAQQRYPMLEICEIPGFQEKSLCGTFEVYEDYMKNKGKKIPIEVVVLPAQASNTAASAFTLHWGGNGSSAKDKIWYFRQGSSANDIRTTRDVVLIDDRGTGASNIRCAAMDSLQPYSYAFAYHMDLIQDCLNEVNGKINLALYNTPGVVKDYDQAREWLGLEQFDFYGISYGVRVGLEYMRNYPEKLRSLTVQGCVPPGFNYVNEMDVAIQEQLEILFQRCKKDSICHKYYPNFEEELYKIRDRLAFEPFQFEYEMGNGKNKIVTIDDLLFRRMVGHQILNGNANETLPLLIHRAYEGNYAPLIVAGGSLTLDMPVFLSQFCPEEIDRFDFNMTKTQSEQLFTQGAIAEEKKFACDLWIDMPAAEWLDEPIKAECPILILTGEYDANTPIRMGELIQKAFPDKSRHIIFPYQGHGSSERTCRFDLITQFVNSKDVRSIDTTCLASIKPTPFAYEVNLSENEFKKYTGKYINKEPNQFLELFLQNGTFYLNDEFSQWAGPSQLLYKGDHTFSLIDCEPCKIIFEKEQNKPLRVQRVYRETTFFEPEE